MNAPGRTVNRPTSAGLAVPLLLLASLALMPQRGGADPVDAGELRFAREFMALLEMPQMTEADAVVKELLETVTAIEAADKRKEKTIRRTWKPHLARLESFIPRLEVTVAFFQDYACETPPGAEWVGGLAKSYARMLDGLRRVTAAIRRDRSADFRKGFDAVAAGLDAYRAGVEKAKELGERAGKALQAGGRKAGPAATDPPAGLPPAAAAPRDTAPAELPTGFLDRLAGAAGGGDADAMYLLARLLDAGGAGLTRDAELGLFWLERAAELDHVPALVRLAAARAEGRGGKADPAAGFALYRRAAERGHAGAIRALGDCALAGAGCERDPLLAAEFYRLAAGRGDRAALGALARLHAAAGEAGEAGELALRYRLLEAAEER